MNKDVKYEFGIPSHALRLLMILLNVMTTEKENCGMQIFTMMIKTFIISQKTLTRMALLLAGTAAGVTLISMGIAVMRHADTQL